MSPLARAVAGYAAAGGVLVAAAVLVAEWLAAPASAAAVRRAALIAYGVQVVSFAGLAASRASRFFFGAWAGGTVVRLGVVLGAGLWLVRSPAFPPVPLLLSLAGFLFLLLLLEPAFFRRGLRTG